MVEIEEFIISSSNDIPCYKVIETKGFAYSLTVRWKVRGYKCINSCSI